jgi:hypothetical protein
MACTDERSSERQRKQYHVGKISGCGSPLSEEASKIGICRLLSLRTWFGLVSLALAMAVAGPSWAQTAAPDQITGAHTKTSICNS